MSPLLGSIGAVSEYSYRGNLDDYPNSFTFTDVTNAEPGTAYTTGITTITGINYKAKVSISGFGSFSINGGAFTTSTSFIRNNETVSIQIPTTSGTSTDFSKLYSSILTIGKVSSDWSVLTKTIDQTPDSFSFTSVSGMEVGIGTTSNTVTMAGLQTGIPISSQIISGIGSFSINGATPVFSGNVTNGDTVQMNLTSSVSFATTNTTTIRVGSFTTTFSVSTRSADTTPTAFTFTDQTDVNFSTTVESNTITVSGCDANVPLLTSISGGGGQFKVVRGGVTVRDYSTLSYASTLNGDQITVRLTSSASGSTSTSTTLTVSGVSDTFTLTTRVPAINTIPSQFTFTDVTGQELNSTITSNTITLSGMTPGENGSASISNGTFRVVRGGSTVRDFSSATTSVQNSDQITLRTTSSASASSTVQVSFTVSGTNTITLPATSGSTSDTWSVTTRSPNCNPLNANYNLLNVSDADRSTTYSQSFTLTDVDASCTGFTVSVTGATAYLTVDGVTGNNLPANYGSNITVFMTSSDSYDTTVSTTFQISRGGSAVVSSSWFITTKEPIPCDWIGGFIDNVDINRAISLGYSSANITDDLRNCALDVQNSAISLGLNTNITYPNSPSSTYVSSRSKLIFDYAASSIASTYGVTILPQNIKYGTYNGYAGGVAVGAQFGWGSLQRALTDQYPLSEMVAWLNANLSVIIGAETVDYFVANGYTKAQLSCGTRTSNGDNC